MVDSLVSFSLQDEKDNRPSVVGTDKIHNCLGKQGGCAGCPSGHKLWKQGETLYQSITGFVYWLVVMQVPKMATAKETRNLTRKQSVRVLHPKV
jgi:hypothetical protein